MPVHQNLLEAGVHQLIFEKIYERCRQSKDLGLYVRKALSTIYTKIGSAHVS